MEYSFKSAIHTMVKHTFLYLILVFCTGTIIGQKNLQNYQLYNAKGKPITFKKMVKSAKKHELVFFGELHNNPVCHWLQMELVKALHAEQSVQIGVEMFERDNELDLQKYLSGAIDIETMDSLVRLWPNYYTDYSPVLEFAKANGIPYSGTNVPRRYASQVYRKDFAALDSLSTEEKSWIAPLPIAYDANLKPYQDMLSMMGGHGGSTLPKAQALKDATMAYFTLKEWEPGRLFIHINGAYHSDNFSSILWYIEQARPGTEMMTITTLVQEDIHTFDQEALGRADYYLVIDEDLTTSY